MAASKIWAYGDMSALGAEVGPGVDLTGYGIEALDVSSRTRKRREGRRRCSRPRSREGAVPRRKRMTLRILVALVAAVAIFASACGGDSGAAPPTVTVNAGQEADASDEATDGTRGEGDIEREGSSGGGDIEVPDVVGLDHQLAQDTMQGAELSNLAEEDATGQGRMLLWDRNWTVVEQEPEAGILVNEDRAIILRSMKDAE